MSPDGRRAEEEQTAAQSGSHLSSEKENTSRLRCSSSRVSQETGEGGRGGLGKLKTEFELQQQEPPFSYVREHKVVHAAIVY